METARPVEKGRAIRGGLFTAAWVALGGWPWNARRRAATVVGVYQAVQEARILGELATERERHDRPYVRDN